MTKYLVKKLAKCKTFPRKCILWGKKHIKDILYQLLEKSKAQGNINTHFF